MEGLETAKSTEKDSLSLKKETFIEAFISSFGNITKTCKISNTSRASYYRWLKDDADFKKAISEIEPKEMLLDFAEDALVKNIKNGSTAEILFVLKTLGKGRGYIEKIQTEDVTEKPKQYNLKYPNE